MLCFPFFFNSEAFCGFEFIGGERNYFQNVIYLFIYCEEGKRKLYSTGIAPSLSPQAQLCNTLAC